MPRKGPVGSALKYRPTMTYRDTVEALNEIRETAKANGEEITSLQQRRNDFARRYMPADYVPPVDATASDE